MVTVLLLYVPLYAVYSFGVQAVFGFFKHDAFYYLTVAKNSSVFFFSYDGETATNGFHPLWQYILTALFNVIGTHDSQVQLYAGYILASVLVTLGYVFAGWALYRVTGSAYWSLLLIPGPFAALFTAKLQSHVAQGVTYTYSPWAFINGMESPCSVAAGGLFLLLLTRMCAVQKETPSPALPSGPSGESSDRNVLALGGVLALVVLARLDNVFLVFTTSLYFLVSDWRGPRRFRRAFLSVLPAGIVLVAYLGFNFAYSRMCLPVSGQLKASGGAALTGNLAMSLCDFFPPLRSIIRPSYSLHDWGTTATRSSAMILPMVFGLWLGWSLLRSRARHAELFQKYAWVLPLVSYMVLKGGYNLVNVRLGSQGYWYYTMSVFMANYLILLVLWETIALRLGSLSRLFRHLCVGLYVSFYLFTSAQTISLVSFPDKRVFSVWRDRHEITAALRRIDPQVKLIDRSDGMYAYALDIPAVCALGYAIDREGYEAMKGHRFLEYCLDRGFQITYQNKNAYAIPEENCTFEKIYEHKESGTVFVRIVPSTGNGLRSPQ